MKILVANRGEIACRILRSLRALGVLSVAVHEPEDAEGPHVFLADEVYALCEHAHPRGYLSVEAIVRAARETGATAVHPGYGFLSQDPRLVEQLERNAIAFIGPTACTMRLVGDKGRARALAHKVGVPIVPGADEISNIADARASAELLHYPVLIKAASGGGGRGMRAVTRAQDLAEAFDAAKREAKQAFGDDRLLMERLIFPARHIEVQVLGDGERAISLGTRECSLQRRYQKVIEEGPASAVAAHVRAALEHYATCLMTAAKYRSLGTVEFLVGPDEAIYFLEVNPRIQVEHPVSEMVGGLDLVARQVALLRGAPDEALEPTDVHGHAIEARLCAESSAPPYLPETGRVERLIWPQGPGLRIDSGIEEGSEIGLTFDPLLAKIIAWGPSRELARRRLIGALEELLLVGVMTNAALLIAWLKSEAFIRQQTFTHTFFSTPIEVAPMPDWVAPLLAEAERGEGNGSAARDGRSTPACSPWSSVGPFRMISCGM